MGRQIQSERAMRKVYRLAPSLKRVSNRQIKLEDAKFCSWPGTEFGILEFYLAVADALQ